MSVKGKSKHNNYAMLVNGITYYHAIECGHLVRNPKYLNCKECMWIKRNRTGRFLIKDGKFMWKAKICGHLVQNIRSDYCRKCYLENKGSIKFKDQENYVGLVEGKYRWKGLVCGHLTSDPRSKYCNECKKNGKSKYAEDGIRSALNCGYISYVHNGKINREHRVIAEKSLGRPLKSNEVVHHINGDKKDNRNCNLLICDKKYHTWIHSKMALMYAAEKFGRI